MSLYVLRNIAFERPFCMHVVLLMCCVHVQPVCMAPLQPAARVTCSTVSPSGLTVEKRIVSEDLR